MFNYHHASSQVVSTNTHRLQLRETRTELLSIVHHTKLWLNQHEQQLLVYLWRVCFVNSLSFDGGRLIQQLRAKLATPNREGKESRHNQQQQTHTWGTLCERNSNRWHWPFQRNPVLAWNNQVKKKDHTQWSITQTHKSTQTRQFLLLLFSTQTRTTEVCTKKEVEPREGRDGSLLELDSINMTRIEQSISVGRKTKE